MTATILNLRICGAMLVGLVASGWAQEPGDAAVVAEVKKRFGIRTKVVQRVDLTGPFQTKGTWSLVVTHQPLEESQLRGTVDEPIAPVHFCFVQNQKPDCSNELLLAKQKREPFYQHAWDWPFFFLFHADAVHEDSAKSRPLLRVHAGSLVSANGNQGISLYLLEYDHEENGFRVVFFNRMGHNNNEEARFLESGPLQGSVVVVYPTENAPFTYFVEVYQRKEGKEYAQVLRYRGKTHYDDGNRLAVIDSEMAEILRRFGFWKPGDPLPMPERIPSRCGKIEWKNGVVWCGDTRTR